MSTFGKIALVAPYNWGLKHYDYGIKFSYIDRDGYKSNVHMVFRDLNSKSYYGRFGLEKGWFALWGSRQRI